MNDWATLPASMTKPTKIRWLAKPEKHDYPAAFSYLCLIYDRKTAGSIVRRLEKAKPAVFKAKDIFRASRLSLLGVSNSHVESDGKKILANKKVSPLLLVRDPANGGVIVADGYHRLCAVYSICEDAEIPCRIA